MTHRTLPWRTALVTGASSGIGEALAVELATRGVEVVACARRRSRLDALVERVGDSGRVHAEVMDVTQADRTAERIAEVDDRLGGLDLIVANAGLGRPQSAEALDWEGGRDVFATNFMGAMATLTAVLPRMVARGRGHLVGVSSVAAFAPTPNGTAYRATKAGLTAFLDNLRAELGTSGVNVTAVHPGFVRTPLADAFPFDPPFIVEAPDAASLIVDRLRSAPARIDFPWPVVWMMRLIGSLPRWVVGPLMRRADLTAGDGDTPGQDDTPCRSVDIARGGDDHAPRPSPK